MAELQLSKESEDEIKEFPKVDWSKVAEEAIKARAFELRLSRSKELQKALLEAISSKSKLSEEEADKFAVELGRKIKKGRFAELKKMGLV